MMKKIVFTLMLISSVAMAQEKVTMNVGDFHSLKTYRGLQVEMIKSNESKVVIEGNRSSEVTVKNSNGILRISMSISHTFSADEVMVYLYYKDEVNLIDANEGSYIFSDEVIKQDHVTLKAQEAGRIKLEVETNKVESNAVTGGEVKVKGTTTELDVKANTGGMFRGERLKSENAEVSAGTGGVADVHALKIVNAKATTGGVVSISGDPEEVKKSESLGGYVRQ
ncbi:head GIN domain-containing protein [Lutimonas zeaxanthinifaciens]|uniref:head GIN domain-containing protein n=1 Tax=Lutimonas zeaxanthinifaciens TaxID=3060215 RepID=UPI00265D40E0|nr:head GIN domain-containing protein [Lutimonas sp. YSD2104]WKK66024.1 head GIN domain-containing protein [Lutimonas sp. YSD2104]